MQPQPEDRMQPIGKADSVPAVEASTQPASPAGDPAPAAADAELRSEADLGSDTDLSSARLPRALHTGHQTVQLRNSQVVGRVLSADEKDALRRNGQLGVAKIRRMTGKTGDQSFGMERELSLVDKSTFRPAFTTGETAIRLLREPLKNFRETSGDGAPSEPEQVSLSRRVSSELFSCQLEHNTSYTPNVTGAELFNIELKIRKDENAFISVAESYGATLLPAGLLASIMPRDIVQKNLFSAPRYSDLGAALVDNALHNKPDFTKTISGAQGDTTLELQTVDAETGLRQLKFTRPNGGTLRVSPAAFLLEGTMTSMQLHFGVPDLDRYLGYHRISDWVGPVLVGLSASSPLLFGKETGFKESRTGFIWDVTTHPTRFGYLSLNGLQANRDSGWIKDTFEQFDVAQLNPLVNPTSGAKVGKTVVDLDVKIALENSKTIWPHTRSTLGLSKDGASGVLRFENRVMSAGPTIIDEVANAVFAYGLIYGLQRELLADGVPLDGTPAELNQRLNFQDMVANMDCAGVDGLDARVRWLDGRECRLADLVRDELLGVAERGLADLGVLREDIDRYLGVIRRRVNFDWGQLDPKQAGRMGITPADVILYLRDDLAQKAPHLSDEGRACKIVSLLCEAAQQDRANPGAGHEDTWDFIRWFTEKYLGESLAKFTSGNHAHEYPPEG